MTSPRKTHLISMVIGAFATVTVAATTNTWDANTSIVGAQDGPGVWSASTFNTNWWSNAGANTNWSNSASPNLTIIGAGDGAAGTITLGEPITLGHLRFNAAGSGSYTIEGNGNALGFGFDFPLLWVSSNVTVTNRANSSSSDIHLNVTGGGKLVFDGINTFGSVDVMDANSAWFGITGGVAGTTITIPAGASFRTTGSPPIFEYSIFGFRLRDNAILNVDGNLTTSARIGGHSFEENFVININPGAVVTNTSDIILGWNVPATMNMNGGYVYTGPVLHQDGGIGVLNLNGGTLETTHIWSNTGPGAFQVNFNGSLVKARDSILFDETSRKSSLSTYLVKDGGAWIDTNGRNIETVIPFVRSGSGGLTKQGAGTMIFSGGSYAGATTVTAGTLNLNFNKRASWPARGVVSDFYDRSSRLVLNGGNFVVTGRAVAPSVTRNFTIGTSGSERCARDANTAGLVAGMSVSGSAIPADTYVTYVNYNSMLIMSKAVAPATQQTVPLTFGAVADTTWQTIENLELQQNATVTVDSNNGPGTTLSVGAITGPGTLTKRGSGTLALYGTSAYGGATLIEGGAVKLTACVTVTNASFEIHKALTEHPPYGYFDTPTDAFWTLTSAGIAAHGSTWVGSNAVIDGNDACFIQASGMAGSAFTTFSVPADGVYIISFMAGKRPTTIATPISVAIDEVIQFSFAADNFTPVGDIYTGSAVLSGGSHKLTFKGTIPQGGDSATWIDRVTITSLADGHRVDTMPTGTTVAVASGAVLDLGGNAQSLAGLSGAGLVTNGTLTVSGTTAPGNTHAIGTLTLATETALTGTLLVDTLLNGTCDLLKVQGSLDVSGAALQVQEMAQLKSGLPYVIATCKPGSLTGPFTSTHFAAGTSWHVVYDNIKGEVRVETLAGTLIMVR